MNPRVDSYRPPWWLPGGHLQTLYASLRPPVRIALSRERWEAPDGDFIDIDWAGDPRSGTTLVLFHGLEGSSDSAYARALGALAVAVGWRFAVAHFRGCSGEPNRLPRAYHSGDSDEIAWILDRFARERGPVFVAGVSLGGNALLKWLGERGDDAHRQVHRAVAVSAPLDLTCAAQALDRGVNRLLYTRHFLATLKSKSLAKLGRFPGLYDARRLRAARSFRDFDGLVTAPLHGFRDADDYWDRASSARWLARVRVPTLVLNAQNDPFLPQAALVAATRDRSPSVVLESPAHGGHVGFIEGPFPGHHAWLPRRILEFLSPP